MARDGHIVAVCDHIVHVAGHALHEGTLVIGSSGHHAAFGTAIRNALHFAAVVAAQFAVFVILPSTAFAQAVVWRADALAELVAPIMESLCAIKNAERWLVGVLQSLVKSTQPKVRATKTNLSFRRCRWRWS